MKITRWGDSLAVKIPDDVAEALHLEEGDSVDLRRLGSDDLRITRRPDIIVQREIDPERRAEALEMLKMLARPLPADYKFDREEANAR